VLCYQSPAQAGTPRANVQYKVVDSDPNVAHTREDIGGVRSSVEGLIPIEKVQGAEQIPYRVDGDVKDTLIVNQRPEFLIHQVADS
jgi:hypothetical protein